LDYPKVANKKDTELIQVLPTLSYKELNDIVGFKGNQTISRGCSLAWIHTVGLLWGDPILIEVENGCEYTPIPDMIEILESEYLQLEATLSK
jgi:hypothetical protein